MIDNIKEISRQILKLVPKNALNDWVIRWSECIISEGTYFEGGAINLDE